MDTKNISNLLLKVGGILILVLSISDIHSYVYTYSKYAEKNIILFVTSVIIPNILPLMLGIFIFLKPEKITNKIISVDQNENEKPQSESLLQIEQICLSTLGFYLLFQSTSDIVFHFSTFFQAKISSESNFGAGYPVMPFIFSPGIITTFTELLFAMWLIFKAKGIVNFVHQIRTTGN